MTSACIARVIGGVASVATTLARAALGGDGCMSADVRSMSVVDDSARSLRSFLFAMLTVS